MIEFFRRKGGVAGPPENRPADLASGAISSLTIGDAIMSAVDTETTGLFSGKSDRVIEIAIVRFRTDGEILDEFETLINPDRDLGPTHIHGITGAIVRHAPKFPEIASEIVSRIQGTVVVGHNIRFDLGFIGAEFDRMDVALPSIPNICTLSLGPSMGVRPPSRSLGAFCEYLGISHRGAHSALGDAHAVAELFSILVTRAGEDSVRTFGDIGCNQSPPSDDEWPELAITGRACPRGLAKNKAASGSGYLSRLIGKLPTAFDLEEHAIAYLELLDRALEDRVVTEAEAEALYGLASECGLTRGRVLAIHQSYLNDLVLAALEDGVVTDAELRDLKSVASALNFEHGLLENLIGTARQMSPERGPGTSALAGHELDGKSVCFTGTSRCSIGGKPISKSQAHELAEAAGLEIRKSVVQDLDILVLADPHSMSGKAKKARQYGIRTMGEEVFWRKIGVKID